MSTRREVIDPHPHLHEWLDQELYQKKVHFNGRKWAWQRYWSIAEQSLDELEAVRQLKEVVASAPRQPVRLTYGR